MGGQKNIKRMTQKNKNETKDGKEEIKRRQGEDINEKANQ
jgi:hypothetical protein